MSKTGLWAVAAIAVTTLLYLVYLAATFEAPQGTTTVIISPPTSPPVQEEPAPNIRPNLPQITLQPRPEPPVIAASEPEIDVPPAAVAISEPDIEDIDGPVLQLPRLNDSDEFVFEGLRTLQNGAALIRLLASEQLIRKFVVLVDNISRGEFPQTALPYRRIEQEMTVSNIDDNLFVMNESSFSRFDQVVDVFTAIDTDQAMALYRTLSPLFQQAYSEIGFRNVNFDDTLRTAILNVLRTADVEGPLQLVKPSVMYLYADSSIENLQTVHKQLVRVGPDNTEKLKARLRQFSMRLQ